MKDEVLMLDEWKMRSYVLKQGLVSNVSRLPTRF